MRLLSESHRAALSGHATDAERIIENLLRRDISQTDRIDAYQALIKFGFTQEAIAEYVGKSRSAISGALWRAKGHPEIPAKRSATYLYRFFDAAGHLLYIGITFHIADRTSTHKRCAHWFDQCVRVELERFSSRRAAMAAEKKAITDERPLFNKVGKLAA